MPATEPPQLSWGNILAAIALATSLLGGFWVVMQSQNSALSQTIVELRLFQQRERDIRREEFRELHRNVPSREEYKEFQNRVDDRLKLIQEQLIRLEATRPTTGELQAISRSADDAARKLDERVRDIERRKP